MFISIEWQTAPELRWALASTVSGPNRCIRRQVSCLSAKRPSVAAHQSVLAVALHGHLCANDLFTARFVAAVQAARSTRMVSEGTNFKRVTPVVRDHEQSAMGELEQPTCFSVHHACRRKISVQIIFFSHGHLHNDFPSIQQLLNTVDRSEARM